MGNTADSSAAKKYLTLHVWSSGGLEPGERNSFVLRPVINISGLFVVNRAARNGRVGTRACYNPRHL